MSFFEITEKDLQDGKAKFSHNEEAELIISSVQKKDIKGVKKIIVDFVVTAGTQTGLKHSEFFNLENSGGKQALGIFLTTFMSAQEAEKLQDPNVLINKKLTCTFVANNGGYMNMRNTRAVSDVPQGLPAQQPVQQPVQNTAGTAPTAQTAAIGEPQQPAQNLNKGLFS